MTTKVASIFFAPVHAERNFGGPYRLPAVPLNAPPVILEVHDTAQIEQGPYQLGTNGKRSRRKHLVLGESIARDIVGEWTTHGVGMSPQCRPGIWVVREQVPMILPNGVPVLDADGVAQWRMADELERELMWAEDLQAAHEADRNYANYLFLQANAQAEEPKLIPFIAQNARRGARQYGLDAEWMRDGAALHVKNCPYCTRVIPARALKCPKCAEIVDPRGYAEMESDMKSARRIVMNDVMAQKSLERQAEADLRQAERAAAKKAALEARQRVVDLGAETDDEEVATIETEEAEVTA